MRRTSTLHNFRWFGLLAFASSACTGVIDGFPLGPSDRDRLDDAADPSRDGDRSNDASGGGSWTGPVDPDAAGALPLRRLTRLEYDNVVRDLLGTSLAPASSFAAEPTGSSGFATPGLMSDVDASLYERAANDLAADAVTRLAQLAPCSTSASDDAGQRACARSFVEQFGLRAYRRPLTSDEIDAHVALYDGVRTGNLGYGFADAMRVLITAMLEAPDFLYHWESSPGEASVEDGVVTLDPFQVASRLSFFIWQSMPDDALLAAATSGDLRDPTKVEGHARRMLDDPRARQMIASFFPQWLHLDWLAGAMRDPALYPEFNAELASSMRAEVLALAEHVMLETQGTLDDLLGTNLAFVDERLARVYGIEGVTGDALVPYELDAAQRPGLLTRAAVLAVGANAYEGDPTKRGKLVREQLLCQSLGAPPPGVPPLPVTADLSIRERHDEHAKNPSCAGCHRLMDPIGFGFGHFDAIGRWIESENGHAIDPSGQIHALDGNSPAFDDAAGLTALLQDSDTVRDCAMRQWLRFAFGRKEEPSDRASMQAVWDRFEASGYSLHELVVSLTSARSFLHRSVADGEPL